jgi:hypothetical protein
MSTQAQKRATAKYHANLDHIRIHVPKGTKDRYKEHAKQRGMSLNALFVDLIEQDIADANKKNERKSTT